MRIKKGLKISFVIFCIVLLFLGFLGYYSAKWYIETYGEMGFDAILYTLFSGLGGVQEGLVKSYLSAALYPAAIRFLLIGLFLFFTSKRKISLPLGKRGRLRLFPFRKAFSCSVSLILTIVLLFQASSMVGLSEYIGSITKRSTLFQREYIDPNKANISFPKEKKNLIYIYLESMETTFFSKEQGGAMDENRIPNLYRLAKENINFSDNEDVGGFKVATGTSWTIGALVAQTSGLPLKIPSNFQSNTYGADSFLPGVTTINDILKEQGYYQAFMIGSFKNFANRDQFFTQHGVDQIYDLDSARADGIVPPKYHQWWGMEDKHLYTYAKQELTKIAEKDQPFSFTMLTVDTHHVGGYFCSECKSDHQEQYENVYSCADRQLDAFISWLKEQPFYENTTIMICGDHASMDHAYMERNLEEGYSRHIYNCIINSSMEARNTKNRIFNAMDLFPTTLAAMGCTFDGDRLGIGTNLFSDTPTLAEEKGSTEALNVEIRKNSPFYLSKFILQ